jgi:hypothetical protein
MLDDNIMRCHIDDFIRDIPKVFDTLTDEAVAELKADLDVVIEKARDRRKRNESNK